MQTITDDSVGQLLIFIHLLIIIALSVHFLSRFLQNTSLIAAVDTFILIVRFNTLSVHPFRNNYVLVHRFRNNYTIHLPANPSVQVEKPRRSPLRLRFFTCTLESASYAIGIVIYETMY